MPQKGNTNPSPQDFHERTSILNLIVILFVRRLVLGQFLWSGFNVDRVTRGKPGPAGIGGVLHNSKGAILLMFYKNVGVRDSNEAEVFAIREALQIYSNHYHERLVAKSDSSNIATRSVRIKVMELPVLP